MGIYWIVISELISLFQRGACLRVHMCQVFLAISVQFHAIRSKWNNMVRRWYLLLGLERQALHIMELGWMRRPLVAVRCMYVHCGICIVRRSDFAHVLHLLLVPHTTSQMLLLLVYLRILLLSVGILYRSLIWLEMLWLRMSIVGRLLILSIIAAGVEVWEVDIKIEIEERKFFFTWNHGAELLFGLRPR